MNEILTNASQTLYEAVGQNKIMTLATKNKESVAARTVNIYNYDGCFYFVTEENSNKYRQITSDNHVALSVDAIQITGYATPLEHPCDKNNSNIINFIEERFPHQFAKYLDIPIMRLIKIKPAYASFILLESGKGFVINFLNNTALPISHER